MALARRARACRNGFHDVLSLREHDIHENLGGPDRIQALRDELGRFFIWCGNIGALRKGPSSLDERLSIKEAAPLIRHIQQVLDDLKSSLDGLYSIASGDRDQLEDDSTSLDGYDGQFSEGSSADSDDKMPTATNEVGSLLDAVTECTTTLLKYSIAIRKASSQDIFRRASLTIPWNSIFDVNHCLDKYPKLKETPWLAERLGKSTTLRRQFFHYRSQHREKLSRDDDVVQLINIPVQPGSVSERTKATTKATTLIAEDIAASTNLLEEVESEGGFSTTTYDTTVGDDDQIKLLRVPPAPPESANGSPFECPFCFRITTVKGDISWKRHVFRDLRPYSCLHAECDSGLFGSRHEWFTHALTDHLEERQCCFCHSRLASKTEMSRHLSSMHSTEFTPLQFKAVIDTCHATGPHNSIEDCPFCHQWPQLDSGGTGSLKAFRSHVGRHMEQLALHALPKIAQLAGEEDEAVDSDNSAVAARSASLRSSFSASDAGESLNLATPARHSLTIECELYNPDTIGQKTVLYKTSLRLPVHGDSTWVPRTIIDTRALIELDHPFYVEDVSYVVGGAMSKEGMERLIKLSSEYKQLDDVGSTTQEQELRPPDSLGATETLRRTTDTRLSERSATAEYASSIVQDSARSRSATPPADRVPSFSESSSRDDSLKSKIPGVLRFPEVGLVYIPKALADIEAIRMSGFSFAEEEGYYVVQEAIKDEEIADLLEISKADFEREVSDIENANKGAAVGRADESVAFIHETEDLGAQQQGLAKRSISPSDYPRLTLDKRLAAFCVQNKLSFTTYPTIAVFPDGRKDYAYEVSVQGNTYRSRHWYEESQASLARDDAMDVALSHLRQLMDQKDEGIEGELSVRTKHESDRHAAVPLPNDEERDDSHSEMHDHVRSPEELMRKDQQDSSQTYESMLGKTGFPTPMVAAGPRSQFTEDEDRLLLHLKEREPRLSWKQIADFFPGRQSGTLQMRYCTKLKRGSSDEGARKPPLQFIDAEGRSFFFPWHFCKTWEDMEERILEVSQHTDVEQHVQERLYDLVRRNGTIILPSVWDRLVQPGWTVCMRLWPDFIKRGEDGAALPLDVNKLSEVKSRLDQLPASNAAVLPNREEGTGYWVCPACGLQARTYGELGAHKTNRHQDYFICKVGRCTDEASRLKSYGNLDDRVCLEHIDWLCLYPDCAKVLQDPNATKEHMSQVHGKVLTYDISNDFQSPRMRFKVNWDTPIDETAAVDAEFSDELVAGTGDSGNESKHHPVEGVLGGLATTLLANDLPNRDSEGYEGSKSQSRSRSRSRGRSYSPEEMRSFSGSRSRSPGLGRIEHHYVPTATASGSRAAEELQMLQGRQPSNNNESVELRPLACPVSGCNKLYGHRMTDRVALFDHVLNDHRPTPELKLYRCSFCEQPSIYFMYDEFEPHLQQAHKDEDHSWVRWRSEYVYLGEGKVRLTRSRGVPLVAPQTNLAALRSVTHVTEWDREYRDEDGNLMILFKAKSVYERGVDGASVYEIGDDGVIQRGTQDAGYPHLTYVAGEIFDVLLANSMHWLARNQSDPNHTLGWISEKHFIKLEEP